MSDHRTWTRLVEGSSWSPSEREIGVFLYGGCAALALAIQKLTGLPLFALVEPDGENERAVHVMAKAPGGRYLDIGGLRAATRRCWPINATTMTAIRPTGRWWTPARPT
jgi:hypothetical protein